METKTNEVSIEIPTLVVSDVDNEQTTNKDSVTTQQQLQNNILTKQPTIIDVLQHKTTWKEFLGFYNILLILTAILLAALIYLSIFVIAYILNPNTCSYLRTSSDHLQYHPFANTIMGYWFTLLYIIAVVQVFGVEMSWNKKQIISGLASLATIVIMLCLYMPFPFIVNPTLSARRVYNWSVFGIMFCLILTYPFLIGG
eukprot:238129_1